MKILITTDLFTVTTNGVVTSVRNLTEALRNRGHDVRILTLSEKYKSHREGDVYYIRSLPVAVYPGVRMSFASHHSLIKELIQWKPDVIHSQCEFFTFRFARRIAKKTGAPIVHTYHTMYEQYVSYLIPGKKLGRWFVRTAARHLLNKVNAIIVPTPKVEDSLHGYQIKPPMEVIPSGISLEQFQLRLSPAERIAKRASLGITEDQTVLISLGRLGYEKNLDELIRFFEQAVASHPELLLMIVGDGPAKSDLEKLAQEKQISDKVIFTGMVPPAEVQNYYQLGDVFVSASTSETQGLTYIEAAANALPLLCRRDPCLEGVVITGENGYTYTADNEFFDALDRILRDPQWIKTAGKRSEQIAETFGKERFGEAVETLYTKLIK
ncbi:MAG: glycosyltransferase family 4 protein [Clostridia bacterium]|nr:glycosyltransferase family 4 protein [Clostridia bacterium]